jgi:hypothetical protein
MKKLIYLLAIVLVLVAASVVYAEEKDKKTEIIKNNLDKIDLGKAPGALRFLLGKPKINIEVKNIDGTTDIYGFKIAGNKIQEFVEGGLDKPHYIIKMPVEAIQEIAGAENSVAKIGELYNSGTIVIEPQSTGAKIKFWLAKKFSGKFAKK